MPEEKKDFEITRLSQKEVDNRYDMPIYMSKINDLSGKDKKRIVEEGVEELDVLIAARSGAGWDKLWDTLDDYYKATDIQLDADLLFHVHKALLKSKVDIISGDLEKAVFDSDPPFSVKPEPEFASNPNQDATCFKKEDFLAHKFDVLPMRGACSLVAHSTVLKGNGILKPYHEINKNLVTRFESYIPKVIELDPDKILKYEKEDLDAQNKVLDKEGKKLIDQSEAERFSENNRVRMADNGEVEKYKKWYLELQEGKPVHFDLQVKETVFNDIMPNFVNLKNFWVDLNVKNRLHMASKNTYELIPFTYKELKEKEDEDEFYDIDKIFELEDGTMPEIDIHEPINIYMAVSYVNLEEYDEFKNAHITKQKRIVHWFHKDKRVMIGSIHYPYMGVLSPYIVFNIKKKREGIYQDGIGIDAIDPNIADDYLLNLMLSGALIANTDTPIVDEDSSIIDQLVSKTFTPVTYITKKPNEKLDFVNNYRRNSMDYQGLTLLSQTLNREIDDVTRVSSLKTGRESIADPTAPASKTMALLEQSGEGITTYIKEFAEGFNVLANVMLQLYAQMTNASARKYEIRPERVVGSKLFDEITREELIAKTKITSKAISFDFERARFLNELMALLQVLLQFPFFRDNPIAVYNYARTITKNWGPMIRDKIDEILPNPAKWEQQLTVLAAKGVVDYANKTAEMSSITGQQPTFDVEQLKATVRQLMADAATPPTEQEAKERKQNEA